MLLIALFPVWAMLTGLRERDGTETATDWVAWLLVLLAPLLLVQAAGMVRAVFLNSGRAVWISGGRLFYAPIFGRWPPSFFASHALDEIDRISAGIIPGGRLSFKSIEIYLKTGGQYNFPTRFLEEPRDVVLERLNRVLAAQR
jgi:hypothetical protein